MSILMNSCDADPVVLAQYIIALIGTGECNDALKTSLESKLNEFFDDRKCVCVVCLILILTYSH